jgi:hypothetical protein
MSQIFALAFKRGLMTAEPAVNPKIILFLLYKQLLIQRKTKLQNEKTPNNNKNYQTRLVTK